MTILFWIIEYMATMIETFTFCMFTELFMERKVRIGKKILYSIIASTLIIVINKIEIFSFGNGCIGILIITLLQMILFKQKYPNIILCTIIYAAIISVIDFAVAQMGGMLWNVEVNYLLQFQSIKRCACVIASKIIMCIILYIIYKYNTIKLNISKKYTVMLSISSIILIAIDYYVVIKKSMEESYENRLFYLLFFIISIIPIFLSLILVVKITENLNQKQNISLLKLQNEMIVKTEKNVENAYRLWRNNIHDYKHKIILMKHWIDENDIQSLKKFIDEEDKNIAAQTFYVRTGNTVVDVIVNTKQKIAEEKGIKFTINAIMPKECVITEMDIVCILGNLLDNAIEACEEQDEKYINVIIKEVKKMLFIKVVNSYDKEFNNEMKTTKEDKIYHGIGLKSIKSIVEKYNGNYLLEKIDNKVISSIMILNKK